MTSVEDKFRRTRATLLEQAGSPAPGGEVTAEPGAAPGWVDVLPAEELRPEVGVPALVGGSAVAVFLTHGGDIYAVSNYDPVSGASVMARGIVGTRGDAPVVASPMYKHVFDLRTGRCLDDAAKCLQPYEVRVHGGLVQVRDPDEGRRNSAGPGAE